MYHRTSRTAGLGRKAARQVSVQLYRRSSSAAGLKRWFSIHSYRRASLAGGPGGSFHYTCLYLRDSPAMGPTRQVSVYLSQSFACGGRKCCFPRSACILEPRLRWALPGLRGTFKYIFSLEPRLRRPLKRGRFLYTCITEFHLRRA